MSRYRTLVTLVAVALAGACCCLAQALGGTDAASAPKPDYDAAFVGMTAPEKVITDQVFAVKITMRNTGAEPWWCEAVRLRSVQPPNNENWGTSFILVRQGHTVQPGAEYTFASHLKAPSQPKVIQVDPRPAEPTAATAPAVPAAEPGRKKVLTFDDFEYVGSFKPPKTVQGARGAFSESGLALREMPDGTRRLLMNYTHPAQVLFEVEIPPLVKVENGRHAGLKVARVGKVWGAIRASKAGRGDIGPNGGFAWDEGKRMLYWTCYHGYKTGAAPPVLGASKLEDDGRMTHFGPWYIPKSVGYYKSYWGGVIRLPKAFADKYTGGRTLALGFGGYYSICAPASRGPALGAIAEPDPQKDTVDIVEMLFYGKGGVAPRDGNYLNANCGFWAEQPDSPAKGYWTYDDWARAGVFVDSPSGHGYIAFVRLGTGRIGYDFGSIGSAGHSQQWYIYDPEDLGRAAKGQKKPWQVLPRSMTEVRYPLGGLVTGSCYDEQQKLLYLCTMWAYSDGERESYPCVHVYRIK
ncbi:MAG: hypothetical protein AMJ81_06690 [Phycisphaerae bacterium SM23_33]|nr:MAG: hypothetical protein AMJ81_06690 [Phycisphaerae bacterium SM23_33]